MLKFFRKIRQNLIDKGDAKRYLYYAIGEILLVVIGILIALQVNNWNQQRIEKQKETLLLKEIHTEFLYNKEEMENTLAYYNKAKGNAAKIIAQFPIQTDQINRDSLASYLRSISFNPSFDVSMGSIAALKNTASFEIISNEELRTLLLRFEDLVADYADRELRSKHFSRDYIDPYLLKRVPTPYPEGLKDERIDLSFLSTIEFENLIKGRLRKIQNFTQILEDSERPLVQSVHRIIALSQSK